MKRAMGGGSVRGPVAHGRQRRTIRLMQALLAAVAAGLLVYAAVAAVNVATHRQANEIDAAPPPSALQPVVLLVGAVIAGAAAALLGGRSGVRLPTPARLDELVGRAEKAVAERSEDRPARV